MAERSRESEKLLRWGFREFENYTLFSKDEIVDAAEVWLGEQSIVPLVLHEDLMMTVPRRQKKEARAIIEYQGPVSAPIREGQPLATLRIEIPDQDVRSFPLYAAQSVDKLGGFSKLKAAVGHLIWGPPDVSKPGEGALIN